MERKHGSETVMYQTDAPFMNYSIWLIPKQTIYYDKVVGMAGIESIGTKYKVRHRAEYGINILQEYWGLGLGTALTKACIECARNAGYVQLELNVVAENERAVKLYQNFGFEEFGRNPRGFNSRVSGYQELIYMLLSL